MPGGDPSESPGPGDNPGSIVTPPRRNVTRHAVYKRQHGSAGHQNLSDRAEECELRTSTPPASPRQRGDRGTVERGRLFRTDRRTEGGRQSEPERPRRRVAKAERGLATTGADDKREYKQL